MTATRIPFDPYYPLVTGYEWIYADSTSGEPLVYAIDQLIRTPTGGVVSFSSAGGRERFIVSRKDLYRSETPTTPILRFPLRDGASWSYEDEDFGRITCQVQGPEEIETPSGSLRDCFRVDYHSEDDGLVLTEWYAWEVGLAKWIEREGQGRRTYALAGLVCL